MTIDTTRRTRADIITGVERPWVEALRVVGRGAVWEHLVDQGVTPALAGNIVQFLAAQADRRPNVSPDSRTNYRKVLAQTPIMFDSSGFPVSA